MAEPTIFALATPPGRSGVAVVRVSGPAAPDVAKALAGRMPSARRATLARLRDPGSGALFDQALLLFFPAPHSFTGEDVLELQVHGSPAVVRSLLRCLGTLPGLRAAGPGDFTRRALMNGRLDLAQVEGLGDLLAAETQAQQASALRLMDGEVSRKARTWREGLLRALALVEASIDFADEEIPAIALGEALALLAATRTSLAEAVQGTAAAERLREGYEVALVGRPNVGKSTLLNAIAGRDAALTSEVAGTTRDVIEVRLDLKGLPVTLLDLAGLREAGDTIEALGVARSRARAETADLRVFLLGGPDDLAELGLARRPEDLVRLAKADLRVDGSGAVSGLTGCGIDELLDGIAAVFSERAAEAGTVTHARQRRAIERAVEALDAAGQHAQEGAIDLASAEVHHALRALEFLVGSSDIEDVLDVIFREFCLGK